MSQELTRKDLVTVALGLVAVVVFVVGVARFHMICDDAYISFRYARNLAEGHGPVWNPGERVEGFTHPLWVALLAAGMVVGADPAWVSLFVGVLSGVGVLALLYRATHERLGPLVWLPVMVVASTRAFAVWSAAGMAASLFALVVLGGLVLALREDEGQGPAWGSAALLALSVWIRPEGGLVSGVVGVFVLIGALRGRRSWKDLVLWGVVWAVPVGALFLARHAYYDAWWPNTATAKITGTDPWRGYRYLRVAQKLHWFWPVTALAAVGLFQKRTWLLGAVTVVYVGYIALIGGDHLGFRFLVPVLPLIAWLAGEGARMLLGLVKAPGWAAGGLTAALAGTVLTAAHVDSTMVIRQRISSRDRVALYAAERQEQAARLNRLIAQGHLPPDLRIAAGGIGVLGYETGLYVLDIRGLTDRQVALSEATGERRIGHQRLASAELIRERGIQFIDADNQVFCTDDCMEDRRTLTRRTLSRWPDAGFNAVCVVTPEGNLIFATPLSEDEVREMMGGLPLCR